MDAKRKRIAIIAGAVVIALAVALSLAWKYTSLGDVLTLANITGMIEAVSGKWWAPVLVVLLYTPACLVMFPRALITLAAAVVFGPLKGFAFAMTGVVLSAFLLHWAGGHVKESTVRRIAGPRIEKLKKMLRKEGLWAITLVGLLPVAPFSVEMIVAGALRVKYRHLLPGVALAHLPGTIGTTLIGDQVMAAMTDGRQINRLVIAAVVVMVVAVGFATRRAWRRLEAA
ncbi:MAG TPA: VTT domain-containing protein [Usitatibacter sp.]|nr:VTT domain-containing protein [Usitatibacter sp.]